MHYERDKTKIYVDQRFERTMEKYPASLRKEINSLRMQKAITLAAQIILDKNSKKLNKEDYLKIAKDCYNINTYILAKRLKRVMKTEEVQKRIDNAIVQSLLDVGIDKEHALKLLKTSEKLMIETKKGKDLKDLAFDYLELLGEMPAKTKVTATQTTNYEPGQLEDSYNTAEKEIKVVRKIEIEGNSQDKE